MTEYPELCFLISTTRHPSLSHSAILQQFWVFTCQAQILIWPFLFSWNITVWWCSIYGLVTEGRLLWAYHNHQQNEALIRIQVFVWGIGSTNHSPFRTATNIQFSLREILDTPTCDFIVGLTSYFPPISMVQTTCTATDRIHHYFIDTVTYTILLKISHFV